MPDSIQSQREDEATTRFLKTNGPPPGVFAPDPWVETVIQDMSEDQKLLHRSLATIMKQVGWVIPEISGLKAAHRTIHQKMDDGTAHFRSVDDSLSRLAPCLTCAVETKDRLQKIDTELNKFTLMRDKYLTRRKMIRNTLIAVATLFFLPFLSVLAVEFIKHAWHWGP